MYRFKKSTKDLHHRKFIIEHWLELASQGASLPALSSLFGISRATFYRWLKQYKSRGLYGLLPKPTRPYRVRGKDVLTKDVIAKIREIRTSHPLDGKVKIHSALQRQGFKLSISSVGRALAYLASRNLITPVPILKARPHRKSIRKFNKHSKRLAKGYKTQIQLDHTIINIHGMEVRQFVAYDTISKFTVSEVFDHATSFNAARFLDKLSKDFPNPLTEIQVDGGSEFRGSFELACKDKNINLFVLPPRSPKLNGGVERLNQTWQDEFYLLHYNELPSDLTALNREVDKWQIYYNEQRLHRSLIDENGLLLTPMQYLKRQNILSHI